MGNNPDPASQSRARKVEGTLIGSSGIFSNIPSFLSPLSGKWSQFDDDDKITPGQIPPSPQWQKSISPPAARSSEKLKNRILVHKKVLRWKEKPNS